jgi:hypothetical protein
MYSITYHHIIYDMSSSVDQTEINIQLYKSVGEASFLQLHVSVVEPGLLTNQLPHGSSTVVASCG